MLLLWVRDGITWPCSDCQAHRPAMIAGYDEVATREALRDHERPLRVRGHGQGKLCTCHASAPTSARGSMLSDIEAASNRVTINEKRSPDNVEQIKA